jgi:hypothetical protein
MPKPGDYPFVPKQRKNLLVPVGKTSIGKLRDDEKIEGLEVADAIFGLRKRGFSHYEIAQQLGFSMWRVKELQEKYRRAVFADLADLVERERELALARLEDVLKSANAIATTDQDNEVKLKAGDQIIRAINSVCKIAGIEKPNPATQPVNNNTNVWLAQEDKFIQSLVASTPRELGPENEDDQTLDLSFDDV